MAFGCTKLRCLVVFVAIFLSLFSAKDVVALYLSMLCRVGSLRSERFFHRSCSIFFSLQQTKTSYWLRFSPILTCSFSMCLARFDDDETCSSGISLDLEVATANRGTLMRPISLVSFHNHNIANDLDNDLF